MDVWVDSQDSQQDSFPGNLNICMPRVTLLCKHWFESSRLNVSCLVQHAQKGYIDIFIPCRLFNNSLDACLGYLNKSFELTRMETVFPEQWQWDYITVFIIDHVWCKWQECHHLWCDCFGLLGKILSRACGVCLSTLVETNIWTMGFHVIWHRH